MRFLGLLPALILIVFWFAFVLSQNCFADNSYTVYAKVPAISSVIVDRAGNIKEILSNSNKPTAIKVYNGSLKGSELATSNKVVNQYNKLTNNGRLDHIGLVYLASSVNLSQTKTSSVKIIAFGLAQLRLSLIASIWA